MCIHIPGTIISWFFFQLTGFCICTSSESHAMSTNDSIFHMCYWVCLNTRNFSRFELWCHISWSSQRSTLTCWMFHQNSHLFISLMHSSCGSCSSVSSNSCFSQYSIFFNSISSFCHISVCNIDHALVRVSWFMRINDIIIIINKEWLYIPRRMDFQRYMINDIQSFSWSRRYSSCADTFSLISERLKALWVRNARKFVLGSKHCEGRVALTLICDSSENQSSSRCIGGL